MIFTRHFVTRENYWQIASIVTPKSLFTVTHALFFISSRIKPSRVRISLRTWYPILCAESLSVILDSCKAVGPHYNTVQYNAVLISSLQLYKWRRYIYIYIYIYIFRQSPVLVTQWWTKLRMIAPVPVKQPWGFTIKHNKRECCIYFLICTLRTSRLVVPMLN